MELKQVMAAFSGSMASRMRCMACSRKISFVVTLEEVMSSAERVAGAPHTQKRILEKPRCIAGDGRQATPRILYSNTARQVAQVVVDQDILGGCTGSLSHVQQTGGHGMT